MLCNIQKHATDDETHTSGQTRRALKEKKQQAEHRFRQQMLQTYTQLDDRDSHESNAPPMNNRAEKQDVDIRISWQQEIDALRTEIVRIEDQTDAMEKLEKETEELWIENQSLRQHILNLTLSTDLRSWAEHSIEQIETNCCPSDPSTQTNTDRPWTRFPHFSSTSFALNKLPRRTKSGCTTSLQRKRWSLSCLFARRSTRRPAIDLGDQQRSKTKCAGLPKKCHELSERNHQLKETNEVTRHIVAQVNKQIAVLQKSLLKLVEAVKRFHGQSIRLSLDLSEHPSSPNAVVDWVPIQHTSVYNNGTWSVFQQSEDDFSELSAFPIMSLEFTPTQRIDI